MRAACLIVLLICVLPARLHAHGGTSHSADMGVDNQLVVGRDDLTLTQVHTCAGKLAADLWAATDTDGDGKLSDAEVSKCIEDSRTVYQQWCRLEVDWKTVLPVTVEVKLTSFPRTRPATFAGAPLVLEHVARYATASLGPTRNVALNCTSLNARTITSRVHCEPGMRIETASLGTVSGAGSDVTGILQQEGSPDQFAFVVRAAGVPEMPRRPPMVAQHAFELSFGVLLLFFGVYYLVSSAVAHGRARAVQAPGNLSSIAASFAVIFAGVAITVHALMDAGCVILRL